MRDERTTNTRRYQQVARQIITMIQNGALPPGERLPAEREFAHMLGVSRPTIREAMVALELAGIVDIRTGSGIYVRTRPSGRPDLASMAESRALADSGVGPIELIEARIVLEPEIAALAATLADQNGLERLRASVTGMAGVSDVQAHREADHQFHLAVAEVTQNAVLVSIVDTLWQDMFSPIFDRLGLITRMFPEQLPTTLDAHRAILIAIESGDADEARRTMRAHLDHVLTVLSRGPTASEDGL